MYSCNPLVFLIVATLAVAASCNSSSFSSAEKTVLPGAADSSIELNNELRIDSKVENGTAYDRADVDLGAMKKVVLPEDATVRRAGEAGKIRIFMAKTLSFAGHPPESMSIRGTRKNMGCAFRSEGDALVIATYGEWDSHIEGGTKMVLVAIVPDGIAVEQRKGLSGPESAGQEWQGEYLTKPKDAQGGYWYGPASPGTGWTAIPTVSDPNRSASK